jgi:hypothetical protein
MLAVKLNTECSKHTDQYEDRTSKTEPPPPRIPRDLGKSRQIIAVKTESYILHTFNTATVSHCPQPDGHKNLPAPLPTVPLPFFLH